MFKQYINTNGTEINIYVYDPHILLCGFFNGFFSAGTWSFINSWQIIYELKFVDNKKSQP